TGGFPEAYGEAQAEYFKSGTASYQEELVAGSPAFAFNEYLQIAVETGIPGLVLFLLLLSDSLFKGVRQKEWGIAGALLAFMLFAFSSYPLQLIPFQILLVFLLVALQPLNEETETAYLCGKRVFSFFLLGICLFASLYVCYRQRDVYANYRKWYQIKSYYLLLDYKKAVEAYGQLLPVFGYQPAFLFEYAQSLSKSGYYAEADKYLMRLSCLSCDAMVYNTMGKNHQENGAYEKAEASFIRAAQLLPGRLYPYYLLAKLYAEPRFYNEQKMKKMACTVLGKEPKVQTTAVREMRAEMRILLKQHDYKDSDK
ncbi:MAG: hypothetical protein PUB21_12835, partial [Bacteroidales bacterium]|nr:hypothetical protein [Bacteroidales bacterium]